mmetsp:Transcript_4482/g.10473  ORF Transcript_4482/g.10473 Transcript_4482/m.10473 type:complete len:93 (+) Transcript_4482:3-281(+)
MGGNGDAFFAAEPGEDAWGISDFGRGGVQGGSVAWSAGGRGMGGNGTAGRAAGQGRGRSSGGPRGNANWSGEAAVTGDLDFSDLDFDDDIAP